MPTADTPTIYPPRRATVAPPRALMDHQDTTHPAEVQTPFGCPASLFTRYDDVRALFRSEGMTSDPRCPGFPAFAEHRADAGDSPNGPIPIVDMDGDEHARFRRYISPLLSYKAVARLAPRVAEITDRLLDAIEASSPPVDLVREFAAPFSSQVACELMGFPEDGRERFGQLATLFLAGDQLSTQETDRLSTRDRRETAEEEMQAYLRGVVAAYETARADPGHDPNAFLDRLLDARDRGELTDSRVIDVVQLTYEGAFHTTASVVALGCLGLLLEPEQAAVIRSDDADLRAAGEEVLRWTSVVNGVARMTTEPLRVGGHDLSAGEGVIVSILAANYDPAVFDDPDALDLRRPPKENLAFGQGRHQCVGQHLARLEITTAIPRLFRRLPDLRLAVAPEEISYREALIQGLDALPVRF